MGRSRWVLGIRRYVCAAMFANVIREEKQLHIAMA